MFHGSLELGNFKKKIRKLNGNLIGKCRKEMSNLPVRISEHLQQCFEIPIRPYANKTIRIS